MMAFWLLYGFVVLFQVVMIWLDGGKEYTRLGQVVGTALSLVWPLAWVGVYVAYKVNPKLFQ